ncbi:hypothetical protein DTO164E3_2990 [Paecilomyces variotii]|nr:hypothetical protein DTO032I3_4589 [Paecilomyces variotii]KAJ9202550.1 hypothetical protein DTO164E3_2990 [Paecilomyces variotii]KAJ9283002.1 hypothetical protein DTO021D3_339 [Paecilomyces variotii]KAJ9343798.1 hypothetical protein DTO027B6_3623 [Paecilomyces variotii]KAJ9387000.1 hypothetical protein DTO032I4_3444 [Paecilomyces variotii]
MQHTQAYSGGAVCRGCRKSFLRGRIFEIDLWSPPLFDGFRRILPKAAPKSQIGARSELIASSPVLRCVLNLTMFVASGGSDKRDCLTALSIGPSV